MKKNLLFWAACIVAFIFWKIVFSTNTAKDVVSVAVASDQEPSAAQIRQIEEIAADYIARHSQAFDPLGLEVDMTLKVDYMPTRNEIEVLKNRCKISEDDAAIIVKFANAMRQENKKGVVNFPVSTRENIAIGEMVADGFDIVDAVNFVVCNKFNDDDVKPVKQLMMTLS